jgi:hypothetical protein
MTTKAQVQKLLKPLIEKYPEFALHGRTIVATPLRRLARYFVVDGTSVPNAFTPTWAVLPLCVPYPRLHMSYGNRIGKKECGSWDITKSDIQQFLMEQFEESVLPIMYSVKTLDDFKHMIATYSAFSRYRLSPADEIIIESALGNFDTARKIWTSELINWTETTHCRDEEDRINLRRRQSLGACLMDDDRAGIAALLHEFEAFTVTSNKLEKIWQPTPFDWE